MNQELETRTKRTVVPSADVYEEGGKVHLRLEMPGVAKDSLEVRIENDELVIQGRRQDMDLKGTYLIRERRPEDFLKRYTLDDTIDRDKVEAEMKNGLLFLSLGIKESSKPKKIAIKVD